MLTRGAGGWDLAVYNQDNQLVLVVEIKNKLNTSSEWAEKLRRNMLAHGTFPKAPYLLMVFPDKLYLWTGEAAQVDQIDAPTALSRGILVSFSRLT